MPELLRLTDLDFKKEVIESNIPVLVDFWASWCPPCKMMEPLISKLAKEYDGKVKFTKVNVDQHRQLASNHHISGVPTIIIFKTGKEIQRLVGAQSKEQLKRIIQQVA